MVAQEHLDQIQAQLSKALSYLDYSFEKIKQLSDDPAELDQETLETWESFCARFARVADIFMAKYIRMKILESDPAFRGTFKDYLNAAEKQNLLDDVETWLIIRGLRNISAHEYNNEDLQQFFKELKQYTPMLLDLKRFTKS